MASSFTARGTWQTHALAPHKMSPLLCHPEFPVVEFATLCYIICCLHAKYVIIMEFLLIYIFYVSHQIV